MSSDQSLPRFDARPDQIVIHRVAEPGGWLSNMSPHPVMFEGKKWWHCEGLFQALRMSGEEMRESIRPIKSPMGAKMAAKKFKSKFSVAPLSDEDVANMRMCLRLKLESHPDLKAQLLASKDALIVEDCSSRGRRVNNLFWGAVRVPDSSKPAGYVWEGHNILGRLWMEERGLSRQMSECHSLVG